MGGTRLDGDDIGSRGRNLKHAIGVSSPNDDLTIVEYRRTEVLSGSDPHGTRQTHWNSVFSEEIGSTNADNRPVGSETQRMGRAGGHGDQVRI